MLFLVFVGYLGVLVGMWNVPKGSRIWILAPQPVVLFCKVVEHLRGGASLKEVHHSGWVVRYNCLLSAYTVWPDSSCSRIPPSLSWWTPSLLKPCAKIEPFSLELLLLRYLVVIMVKVTFTEPWKRMKMKNPRSYSSAMSRDSTDGHTGNRDFCFWSPCFTLQAWRSWLFYSTHLTGMEEPITSVFFLAASRSRDFKTMHGVIMAVFSSAWKKPREEVNLLPQSVWVQHLWTRTLAHIGENWIFHIVLTGAIAPHNQKKKFESTFSLVQVEQWQKATLSNNSWEKKSD